MNQETARFGQGNLHPSKEEHTQDVRTKLYAEFDRLEGVVRENRIGAGKLLVTGAYDDTEKAEKEGHITAEEAEKLRERAQALSDQLHYEEAA